MADTTHIHGRPRAFGPHEIITSGANSEPIAVSAANAAVGAALVRTATGFAFGTPTGIPATSIGGGTIDNTEFGFLNGVTSNLQTQLNGKWGTSGNSGLSAANFIGHTDNVDLILRANNSERARFLAANTQFQLCSAANLTGAGQRCGVLASTNAIISAGNSSMCIGNFGSSTSVSGDAANAILFTNGNGTRTVSVAGGRANGMLFCSGGTFLVNGTTNPAANAILCSTANCTIDTNGGANVIMGATATSSITGNGSGNFLAAGGGTISGGSRNTVMSCVAGTIDPAHSNAAVIGGNTLTSQASNSLTSNAMYATAFNVTCDASEKKAVIDSVKDEGSDAFTAKLMSVKPKQYRLASEDDGAPKRAGFVADEVEAAFPGVVKRTWRNESVASYDEKDGQWKDDTGRVYREADVDKSRAEKYAIAELNWGMVYTDEPLQHAVIDTTAMMSALLSAVRHLQIQSTAQKAEIAALKSDVALLKANVTIRL